MPDETPVDPMDEADPFDLLNDEEVAKWVKMSRRTLQDYRYTDRGKGPPFYPISANVVRYSRREVAQWLLRLRKTGREKESGLKPEAVRKAIEEYEQTEVIRALGETGETFDPTKLSLKSSLGTAADQLKADESERAKRPASGSLKMLTELSDDNGMLFATIARLLEIIDRRGLPERPTPAQKAAVATARGMLRGTRWERI
jgi:predicted DNA-binding transcriptional regulator AlpA